MSYIALRDFDGFKKGDTIPAEFVQDRLIRGRKIGLADGSVKSVEKKEELITEVVKQEIKEELLIEDSSDVSVEIKEEIVSEIPEIPEVKETKKSKK